MKKICIYLRKTSSMVLVIMLMLSMMSGVLTLSAAADESTLPELVNKPILTWDLRIDKNNSNRTPYYVCNDPVVLNFDRAESEGSGNDLNDIVSISYHSEYSDKCTVDGTWYQKGIIPSSYSGTNTGGYCYEYSCSYYYSYNNGSSGYWSSGNSSGMNTDTAFYVVENFSTVIIYPAVNTYYYTMWDGPNYPISTFDIVISYANGVQQPIHVDIMAKEDSINWQGAGTSESMALSLAHSTTIDDEDFYELENAIFAAESEYDNTTKRFYVDAESNEDIVLPINHMSSNAYLVQTRVGENVVYNTAQSVDFGDNAVSPYPEGADVGRVFTLPDGSYMSEEDIHNMYGYLYDNGFRMFMYNGAVYGDYSGSGIQTAASYPNVLKISHNGLPDGLDFVWNGYAAKGMFTGIPGTNFDQTAIDNSVNELYKTAKSSGIWSNTYWGAYHPASLYRFNNPGVANVTFNQLDSVSNQDILAALNELLQADTTSDNVKSILNNSMNFGLKSSQNSNYSTYCRLSMVNDYLNNSYYNYDELLYMQFCSETRFDTADESYVYIMTQEQRDAIIDITQYLIDKFGEEIIDLNKTFIPKYTSVDEIEWTPILSYLEENGMTESEGKVLSDAEDESYPFLEFGTIVDTAETSDTPLRTDTYKNKEIRFKKSDVKYEKGVPYNVVNQVAIYNMSDSVFSSYDGETGDMYAAGGTYYLNGEFIRHSETERVNKTRSRYIDGYTDNGGVWHSGYSEYYVDSKDDILLRHTEYKWGELVFATRPDPVERLRVDKEKLLLEFDHPTDEGFGTVNSEDPKTGEVTKATRVDQYVNVGSYTINIFDEDGNNVYKTKILRYGDNETLALPKTVIDSDKTYRIVVIATNVLGDSDEREVVIVPDKPEVTISITSDKEEYRENETVTFTETVTNTGNVTLTNVVVTQEHEGEYVAQDGLTVKRKLSAKIPNLQPGESYTFSYTVPASTAEDAKITNECYVTTAQEVEDDDECTVRVLYPAISVVKDVVVRDYKVGDTVIWTDTVTNTGDYPLTNVVVREIIPGTFITDEEYEQTDGNAIIIPVIGVGESITFQYKVIVDETNVNQDLCACSVTATAAEGVSDDDIKDVPIINEPESDTDIYDSDSRSSGGSGNSDIDSENQVDTDPDSDIKINTDSDASSDSNENTDSGTAEDKGKDEDSETTEVTDNNNDSETAEDKGKAEDSETEEDTDKTVNSGSTENTDNAGNSETTEDTDNTGNSETTEDTDNAGNSETTEDTDNSETTEDTDNAGNSETTEDTDNAGNSETTEDTDDADDSDKPEDTDKTESPDVNGDSETDKSIRHENDTDSASDDGDDEAKKSSNPTSDPGDNKGNDGNAKTTSSTSPTSSSNSQTVSNVTSPKTGDNSSAYALFLLILTLVFACTLIVAKMEIRKYEER